MDTMTILALAIFAVTIVIVITGWIDSTPPRCWRAVMIWLGLMNEDDAFKIVDWNVMAILVSIWTIAGYFGKSGIPEWLSVKPRALARQRRHAHRHPVDALRLVSMVVDNVVVISCSRGGHPLAATWSPLTPLVLMIGFSANFMGSAMLLGDCAADDAQRLGAEFFDFIWSRQTQLLPDPLVTFTLTLALMYCSSSQVRRRLEGVPAAGRDGRNEDPGQAFATIVMVGFIGTIVAMSMREHLA